MKKLIFLICSFILLPFCEQEIFAKPVINLNIPKHFDKEYKFNLYEFIEARRGGRGGGSFGRSRSSAPPRTQQAPRASRSSSLPSNPAKTPSFGGKRITKEQATAKYGVPRRTSEVVTNNQLGQQMNYRLNDYGGFSSGLMYGYMMGNMAWWMTIPAFFYSKPVYAENPDGTVDVYPPTFDFGKFLVTLIVVFAIIYLIRAIIFSRKNSRERQQSSFV